MLTLGQKHHPNPCHGINLDIIGLQRYKFIPLIPNVLQFFRNNYRLRFVTECLTFPI